MNKKHQVANAVIKYRKKLKCNQQYAIKSNKVLKLVIKEAYKQGKFDDIIKNVKTLDLNDIINKLVFEEPYFREKVDNTKYSYTNKSVLDNLQKILISTNYR